MDPGGAIGAPGHSVNVDDRVGQVGVVEVLLRDRVGPPGLEARARHLHDPTAGLNGQVRTGSGDEGVDHFRAALLGAVHGRPLKNLDLRFGRCAAPGGAR